MELLPPLKRGERDVWPTTRTVLLDERCPTTASYWAVVGAFYDVRARIGLPVIDEEPEE